VCCASEKKKHSHSSVPNYTTGGDRIFHLSADAGQTQTTTPKQARMTPRYARAEQPLPTQTHALPGHIYFSPPTLLPLSTGALFIRTLDLSLAAWPVVPDARKQAAGHDHNGRRRAQGGDNGEINCLLRYRRRPSPSRLASLSSCVCVCLLREATTVCRDDENGLFLPPVRGHTRARGRTQASDVRVTARGAERKTHVDLPPPPPPPPPRPAFE